MKYILTILLNLFLVGGFSQPLPNWQPVQNAPMNYYLWYGQKDSVYMYSIKDTFNARYPSVVMRSDGVLWKTLGNGAYWYPVGSGAIDTLNTLVTHTALNDTLLGYVKIQTQNPTATLTGGFAQEVVASGAALSYTLNWGAGRLSATSTQAATNPLATIVVAGTGQTFTQPSAGSTVTGTKGVSVTRNTTTTYSNVVTTTDSKTATATTTFSFYNKRYLGFSATTTPTQAEILAALYQDNSGGTTSLSYTIPQQGSAKYLFYVNTSTVTSVTVNGFPSTSAFSLNNSITFTNASGGTYNGYYTVSNNQIGNLSATAVTFQ
jgi:hypothetical protein